MKYCYCLIPTILILSMSFAPLVSSENQLNYKFGVVYGSDETITKAQFEIDKLRRILPQYRNRVFLFKRREFYASVVLFTKESEAKNSLQTIENEYARGSFLVDLQNWCRNDWSKNTGKLSGVDYYDCKRGEIIPGKTGAIIIKNYSKLEDAKKDLDGKLKDKFSKEQYNLTIFNNKRLGNEKPFYTALINYANVAEAKRKHPEYKKTNYQDINNWCFLDGNITDPKPTPDGYIQCKSLDQ